ncbi:nuclease domain protein [Aspergillus ellipticus CBS 707.79]|uniref:Probable endonuclease LCL3 n=1 Tax=Aspergillus ellipticus CBS 707.79 TaxID=1448320 RepID=A0A319DDY4_9EURO|nr:nuclease domain protein [Aspergillus ellipticus CBS 707.79]
MRWPPWTPKEPSTNNDDPNNRPAIIDWSAFTEPRTLIPTLILTSGILGAVHIHRNYLRRIPTAVNISPSFLRRRSILGQVTSVGDGDNFRIYHTPGGRLTGWGWLPWKKVPTTRKELKDKTIHVRLAGIDAPELAHFGKPAQPFGKEAHDWLTAYLTNRRVRAYVHRQDQYQRVVATVVMRRALDFPIPFRRRDVSYEMLRRGLATVYEAKFGAEFGGAATEKKYRKAESRAKTKGTGLWKAFHDKKWESPREFKTRMGLQDDKK